MIRISTAQLWVHDQDEALAFYTDKLGMELRADVSFPEMGSFRWLTVGPPGQDDVSIVPSRSSSWRSPASPCSTTRPPSRSAT